MQTGLSPNYDMLCTVQNLISWPEQVYETYHHYTGDLELTTKAQHVSKDKNELDNLIQTVEEDPTHTDAPAKYRSLSYGLPVLTSVLATPVACSAPWVQSPHELEPRRVGTDCRATRRRSGLR